MARNLPLEINTISDFGYKYSLVNSVLTHHLYVILILNWYKIKVDGRSNLEGMLLAMETSEIWKNQAYAFQ